jgi:hypothetical protein
VSGGEKKDVKSCFCFRLLIDIAFHKIPLDRFQSVYFIAG